MANAYFTTGCPTNDRFNDFLPGSAMRKALKDELRKEMNEVIKIPLIIDGQEIFTEKTFKVTMPHDHGHVLAECSVAGERELKMAIRAALKVRDAWARMPWQHRGAIFLKAADMITGSYRPVLLASTMLGQSKTAMKAEVDIAELADFLRFGVWNLEEIFAEQPMSDNSTWNRQDYRPLDGFVCAVTPFNFTSIAGNLPSAPAMAGNVAVWKPSRTAVLSNYYFMKLLMNVGLPHGVINFVPCAGSDIDKYVLTHPSLAGFHFTGSTEVFENVWKTVGRNIGRYKNYPRIVGETGGKDFIFAHKSADIKPLVSAIVRASFEVQGQMCSACSRVYIPESIWPEVKKELLEAVKTLKVGDVAEFDTFLGAMIDQKAFETAVGFIERAKASPACEIIAGGTYDSKKGWFIDPTVILCHDPHYETMLKEIFAPIVSVYVYPDSALKEVLRDCDKATQYALTGAIFAQDREAIEMMEEKLRDAAGNFYINDKCTGAVVGQQPFGGARASGTNDKAGTRFNMIRWLSVHTTKETFNPTTEIAYPYMKEKD